MKTSRILGLVLALALLAAPSWGERVTTDGNNKNSPIKVNIDEFVDSGYGLPGPQATIQMSTTITNSSKKDDLRNVVIELQLKNLNGDVVKKWTKNVSVMKKGASMKVDSDGIFYNTMFNNVKGAVQVTHDKPIKKKEEKKK